MSEHFCPKFHTDIIISWHFERTVQVHVKQGVVKSLFDRGRRVVTRESDLREEEKHLRQVLLNNGYPQPFIDKNSS